MAQDISDDVKQWTAKRRQEIVLQLLRGETTVAEAAQKNAFTSREIEGWLDKALTAMENALTSSPQEEAEQNHLRDLARIGLLFGESFHYARNHLGMAKTLAANIKEGRYDSDLRQIKFSAEKIINNINAYLEVLELAQDRDTSGAENSTIDLHGLLMRAIRSKRIPRQIAISTKFSVVNPKINAPLKQLQQVFFVFLQNALDAINDTHGRICISTDEDYHGELKTIKISISNTGRAIPQELREELFSFKAFKSTSQSQRLGLGLAWAHSFLRNYGGKITYETSEDGGTTFHLSLPKVFKERLE